VAAKPHSSSFRGVSWHERSKRWEVRSAALMRLQHFQITLCCWPVAAC
jgi:hypothetical protein